MSRPVDLYSNAQRALYHPDKNRLLAPLNLDSDTAFLTGAATVRADSDGLFAFDDDGPITAAIWAVMPGGVLIDLAAVDIARPNRVRRFTGLGALLGEDNVIGCSVLPLLIHPGPYEWALAGGEGCAVLEFTPSVCELLRSIPGGLDVADDPVFAEELERQLTEPARRPMIYVQQRRAA